MGKALPQIVLFGDSLTQYGFQWDKKGWGTSLADHYSRKADVVLRGYAAYNTRWACELLDRIFPIPSPNTPLLVTVFFGANDAADPSVKQIIGPNDPADPSVPQIFDQHVPLPEYKKNLRQIVAHLKKQSDQTHVVLITPPPVSEKNFLIFLKSVFGEDTGASWRRNELTKLYAEECVKVGQEEGLPVINLWSIFQEDPDWEEKFLCDGLHLSAEGNAKLFDELVKVVSDPDLVPTLIRNDMPWDFPDFLDLCKDPVDTLRKWCASKSASK